MRIVGLFLLFLIPDLLSAQVATEEAKVEAVIHSLFEAMYKGDTVLLKSVFADKVTMATVFRKKEGVQQLRRETGIADFVKAIGKPQPEPLSEEIWNVKVQVDGEFAQAWCDYAFYIGNRFSHCGVDAFHLFKTQEGWKIFHLADTRRKEGCSIPESIQKKHK